MKNENQLAQQTIQRSVQKIVHEVKKDPIFDKTLHVKFVKLGNDRRRLTNELLALLPEIYEKGIYRKYARDIEEYAWKFGGLGYSVVRKRLRIEKYVYDKPMLKDAIRTEGVHKVAMLASLATKENESLLVDKLKNMSKPAIQELSKELRTKQDEQNSLFETDQKSLCKAVPVTIKLELDEEMSTMFLKLKKVYGEDLSNKEVMRKMMEELLQLKTEKSKIDEEKTKEKIEGKQVVKLDKKSKLPSVKVIPAYRTGRPGDVFENQTSVEIKQDFQSKIQPAIQPKNSIKIRHQVSPKIRKEIFVKNDCKCSYPGCNRPAENVHHPERFAESKNHNNLKPLCKIHHEFMHNGLVSNQAQQSDTWQLSLDEELTYADQFYRYFRRK